MLETCQWQDSRCSSAQPAAQWRGTFTQTNKYAHMNHVKVKTASGQVLQPAAQWLGTLRTAQICQDPKNSHELKKSKCKVRASVTV